jgi:hypothetical protein
MSAAAQFNVTLCHLTRDLTRAGKDCAEVRLPAITPVELRRLLEQLARLAPTVSFPAEPELRINGPQGQFLVQVRNGHVRMVSWSAQQGGTDLAPDRILAIILGLEQGEVESGQVYSGGGPSSRNRAMKITLLIAALLGTNGFTAWMLTRPSPRPPAQVLAEYRAVLSDRAERMFAEFAGIYETGQAEGDRRLVLKTDGSAQWIQFGPNQSVAEETALTTQAAESRGRSVLVANNFGMIEMKDPLTLLYFNDPYRRITR